MIFSLITNDPRLAGEAEAAGIQRIMIDLETHGKAQRQAGQGLFLSTHRLADIPHVKQAVSLSELVVRINPLHAQSGAEIADVIDAGADFIMLPFFQTIEQVVNFHALIAGRVRTILLVETGQAVSTLESIIERSCCDEVHVGLNDLALSLGRSSIFDLVLDGTLDAIASLLSRHGKPYGMGGVGALGRLDLPVSPLAFFIEQISLGASRGWLGRSFRDVVSAGGLDEEVRRLFAVYDTWSNAAPAALARNQRALHDQIRALSPAGPGGAAGTMDAAG
jgi:hypothetical protein